MMKKPAPKRTRSGLTLIEVLIVIAFLGVAFFPILEMLGRSFLISSESEMTLKAISFANRAMEQQLDISFSALQSRARSQISGEAGFFSEITVTEPAINLKQVQVIVYYPVGNSELSMDMKTLVANY